MRSVKKGSIQFGLVSVATKMYSAVEDHDIKGHQLHDKDHGQIRYKRVCEICGEVVENADIVKGIEHGEKHVVITKDDLAAIEEEAGPNFEVLSFVHRDEIDPILFESTYYLDADKGAEEGYALLRHVLNESERFGIVQFTYRSKTRMGVLRVYGDVLAIHTIRWHDEVRGTSELLGASKAKSVALNPKMVKLAHAVMDSMVEDWEPEQYVDTYTVALAEMVETKANGGEYVAPEEDDSDGAAEVADLLAKLEAMAAVGTKKKKQKQRRTESEIAASAARHPAGKRRAVKSA